MKGKKVNHKLDKSIIALTVLTLLTLFAYYFFQYQQYPQYDAASKINKTKDPIPTNYNSSPKHLSQIAKNEFKPEAKLINHQGNKTLTTQISPDFLTQLINVNHPNNPDRIDMIRDILLAWSQIDPEAALSWINSVAYHQDVEHLIFDVMQNYIQFNITEAGDAIRFMPDSPTKQKIIHEYLTHFSHHDDLTDALSWIDSIGPAYRAEAIRVIFTVSVNQNPLALIDQASYLTEQDQAYIAHLLYESVYQMNRNDAEYIFASAGAYSDLMQVKISAGAIAAFHHSGMESAQIIQAINHIQSPKIKWATIDTLIESSVYDSPQLAFSAATLLADETVQADKLRQIFQIWQTDETINLKQVILTAPNISRKQQQDFLSLLN